MDHYGTSFFFLLHFHILLSHHLLLKCRKRKAEFMVVTSMISTCSRVEQSTSRRQQVIPKPSHDRSHSDHGIHIVHPNLSALKLGTADILPKTEQAMRDLPSTLHLRYQCRIASLVLIGSSEPPAFQNFHFKTMIRTRTSKVKKAVKICQCGLEDDFRAWENWKTRIKSWYKLWVRSGWATIAINYI